MILLLFNDLAPFFSRLAVFFNNPGDLRFFSCNFFGVAPLSLPI